MTFTGDVDDDESDVTRDRDWSDYWRLLFKKVSVDDIKTFEKDYKGSCHQVVSVHDITIKVSLSVEDMYIHVHVYVIIN